MPRCDVNQKRREEIKKFMRTMENLRDNHQFLQESGGELTPNQLSEVRDTQSKKLRYLNESKGTIQFDGDIK